MGYLRTKAIFQCLILLCALFTISLLSPSADARDDACCEKTTNGDSCVYTALRDCDSQYNIAYTTCEQTSYCQPVCCIDTETGACYKQVGASTCAQRGGTVVANSPDCSVTQCQVGCCQIGNQCSLSSESTCQLETNRYPASQGQDTFDATITDELQCINQCRATEEGCCVNDESCSSTTLGQCSGTFASGKFCSDSSLGCGVRARDHKGCVDGSDDVYWFDNEGNKESVAEDCDYTRGTSCGLVNGQTVCKSLDCADTLDYPDNVHDPQMGKFRYNGESWCVYESGTGDYRDRVGSEHYRHLCIDGEEHVEESNYREQICIQTTVTQNDRTLTQARFINNQIYDSAVTENISTVQRGFAFWETSDDDRTVPQREGKDICSQGNVECKVTYVKKSAFSGWNCKSNCQCETQQFIDASARYCKSKGDCGANYNVLGEKSNSGFQATWTGSAGGPKLTQISEETWNNWSQFGVFGGMVYLEDAMQQPELFTSYSLAQEFTLGIQEYFHKLGYIVFVYFGYLLFLPLLFWNFILGGAKVRTKTLAISCEPWAPPVGGQNCEKCDDDLSKPCTAYRCHSLGAACTYLVEDRNCAASDPNDAASPQITPWDEILTDGYTLSPTADGYSIQPALSPFTSLTFGITTDELAQCKIDTQRYVSTQQSSAYDQMSSYFGSSLYLINHNITVSVSPGQDITYYALCQDVNGASNERPYFIRFSVNQQPDLTPPRIVSTSLADGVYLPVGTTETSLTLYLNEPSECRWNVQDQSYQDMPEAQAFLCEDEISQDPLHTRDYVCGGELTGLQDNTDNHFYLRCKDLQNNEQQQSTSFHLQGTAPLQITSASPQGNLLVDSPTLQVTTSGGAEQGIASCTYQTGDLFPLPFFITNNEQHSQQLTHLSFGDYSYLISCHDAAGNGAEQTLDFSVTTDHTGPVITQVYSREGTLYVLTNEASTCAYSTTTGDFSRETGTLLQGENSLQHSLHLDALLYSLKCWDSEQNMVGPITVRI